MEGILLINKTKGKTSFNIVSMLRKKTGVKKIGHAGTLDPFATGVMVMLIGKKYTSKSNEFISHDKEYIAEICLGYKTPSYDTETEKELVSTKQPSLEEIEKAIEKFQGNIEQTPPMYSAKKVNGQKLYNLARKNIEIERKKISVFVETSIISYNYPILKLKINCSKGTYIRSIAHDLGIALTIGGYLQNLKRTRSGPYNIKSCLDQEKIFESDLTNFIQS